jgi:branched-chain amino acid aminotransferase
MKQMYYNESTIIYHDGIYVKANEAKTDLYGQSLHYGYAVFEGIRAYKTASGVSLFKGLEHYQRLQRSAEAMGIPYPLQNEELVAITHEVLRLNGFENAYIRPLLYCPPNMSLQKADRSLLAICAWEWGAYLGDKLLRVMTSSYQRPNPKGFKIEAKVSGHYVNSILACQEAKHNGYDEALLLDMNGYAAEAPGANIFFEKNGCLYTPPAGNILPGITRATVIELCEALDIPVKETLFTVEEIKEADAAFFCGTAAEIVGWASIDDNPFKKEWNDSLGSILQKAYKARVQEEAINTFSIKEKLSAMAMA